MKPRHMPAWAAAVMAAAVLAPGAALAQAWQTYAYADAGFAVQLPAAPVITSETVKTDIGPTAPVKIYTATEDGAVFTMKVFDLSAAKLDGKDAIAKAEKAMAATGRITSVVDARINREFGRELSLAAADGSRANAGIFFIDNHLYELVGRSLPPNPAAKSGDTVRFQQSLQFLNGGGRFGGAPGEGAGPPGGDDGPGGPGGFGGGRSRGFGGRGGGGPNPQAAAACMGRTAGAKVQLQTPEGAVAATCTLLARPDRPPGPGGDGPPPPRE